MQQSEKMPESLRVAEHFYSIQGEGPTSGRRAVFLRLKSCNLLCGGQGTAFDKKLHDGATWRCDTVEVWLKGSEIFFPTLLRTFDESGYLKALEHGAHLIATGGEPLLQQKDLAMFLFILKAAVGRQFYTEIETNGTVFPSAELMMEVNQINCSPKLSNSGVPREKRINEHALDFLAAHPDCIFKFVVSRLEDLKEIEDDFLGMFPIRPSQVWLMPAASNRDELNKNSKLCVDAVKECGYNFSSRLQVAIWNETTGV